MVSVQRSLRPVGALAALGRDAGEALAPPPPCPSTSAPSPASGFQRKWNRKPEGSTPSLVITGLHKERKGVLSSPLAHKRTSVSGIF